MQNQPQQASEANNVVQEKLGEIIRQIGPLEFQKRVITENLEKLYAQAEVLDAGRMVGLAVEERWRTHSEAKVKEAVKAANAGFRAAVTQQVPSIETAAESSPAPAPKKRGRKPGKKNDEGKKKPGRKPGAAKVAAAAAMPKKRGRKPGRPRRDEAAAAATVAETGGGAPDVANVTSMRSTRTNGVAAAQYPN